MEHIIDKRIKEYNTLNRLINNHLDDSSSILEQIDQSKYSEIMELYNNINNLIINTQKININNADKLLQLYFSIDSIDNIYLKIINYLDN